MFVSLPFTSNNWFTGFFKQFSEDEIIVVAHFISIQLYWVQRLLIIAYLLNKLL